MAKELTPINDLLKGNQLVPSRGSSITTAKSTAPMWGETLMQLAQDKKYELPPGTMKYWREKLSNYRAEEIREGLMLYAGEYFPSIDNIIEIIERARERRAEEKQAASEERVKFEKRQWDEYCKANNIPPGTTPMQWWCRTNPEALDKLRQTIAAHVRADRAADAIAMRQAKVLRGA